MLSLNLVSQYQGEIGNDCGNRERHDCGNNESRASSCNESKPDVHWSATGGGGHLQTKHHKICITCTV